jgi:hypothetical protein
MRARASARCMTWLRSGPLIGESFPAFGLASYARSRTRALLRSQRDQRIGARGAPSREISSSRSRSASAGKKGDVTRRGARTFSMARLAWRRLSAGSAGDRSGSSRPGWQARCACRCHGNGPGLRAWRGSARSGTPGRRPRRRNPHFDPDFRVAGGARRGFDAAEGGERERSSRPEG